MSAAQVEAKVVLCPELAGILMTPEEFDEVEEYDDGYCYELIHGILVVTPLRHEAEVGPNELLGHLLRDYPEQHSQGASLDATLPERFVRTRDSRRRADRVIWAGLGRMPDPRSDPPTIVVEFVSAARRDRRRDYVEKRQEYMDIGIAEYWIIDRFRRHLTVIRNQPAGQQEQTIPESEIYRTPALPGFELPLAKVFAVADRWQQSH
jgi:Uma2 family endonuclease